MSKKKVKKKTKYQGIFNKTSSNYGFVQLSDSKNDDVFIPGKYINTAMNGDLVEFQIDRERFQERKAEGRILRVLKREITQVVGIYQKSRNFGFVVPDNKKLGTDIFISKNKNLQAKDDDKVVVKITKYPELGKNAEGEVIEVLGNIDQAGVDLLSVVREFDLRNEFPDSCIVEANLKPTSINPKLEKQEYAKRKDFRDYKIFTIDGEDAKDLDDAIHVERLENGNYELDVHIADVSHYVTAKSELDKEAIKRGTSVYMFDRVIPMIPTQLSNGICSLNAGVDRFCLSCLMEIDSSGKVLSSQICKSVINVTQRMSYTDVDIILSSTDDRYPKQENNTKSEEYKKEVLEKYKEYFEDFKLMNEIALILKKRRIESGYLNLDIPESKLTLDEEGKCINVEKYNSTFANEIIEHFMLTANETVAEKFYWLEAPFIYRVHEVPDYDKISDTNQFLANIGYHIKATKDNIKPTAFSKVLEEIKGTEYEKVISTLLLRTLKVADYQSENKGHFGISSKYYCHFTSPIRRYPDLFIHRIISEYIENDYNISDERKEYLSDRAHKYSISSSDCERQAVQAEREAEDIKKAEYMESKIGEEYFGIVSSVTGFGMFVELDNTIEGLCRFENMGEEYWNYDSTMRRLISEDTNKTYSIGDKVKIRVLNSSKETREIDFELVNEKEND